MVQVLCKKLVSQPNLSFQRFRVDISTWNRPRTICRYGVQVCKKFQGHTSSYYYIREVEGDSRISDVTLTATVANGDEAPEVRDFFFCTCTITWNEHGILSNECGVVRSSLRLAHCIDKIEPMHQKSVTHQFTWDEFLHSAREHQISEASDSDVAEDRLLCQVSHASQKKQLCWMAPSSYILSTWIMDSCSSSFVLYTIYGVSIMLNLKLSRGGRVIMM